MVKKRLSADQVFIDDFHRQQRIASASCGVGIWAAIVAEIAATDAIVKGAVMPQAARQAIRSRLNNIRRIIL